MRIMLTDKFSPATRFRAACNIILIQKVCIYCHKKGVHIFFFFNKGSAVENIVILYKVTNCFIRVTQT